MKRKRLGRKKSPNRASLQRNDDLFSIPGDDKEHDVTIKTQGVNWKSKASQQYLASQFLLSKASRIKRRLITNAEGDLVRMDWKERR